VTGTAEYDYVALPSDTVLRLDDGEGDWAELSVATLSVISSGQVNATPGDLHYCCGFSPNGRYFTWAKYGWADVVDTSATPSLDQGGANPAHFTTEPVLAPDQFAVANDGTEFALAGGGLLDVALAAGAAQDNGQPTEFGAVQDLPGTGRISALAFLGQAQQLISANGSALALWEGSQVSRIVTGQIVDTPVGCGNAGFPPQIGISPDSTRIATASAGELPAVLETNTPRTSSTSISQPVDGALPVWAADGKHLFLLGDAGSGMGALVWSDGSFRSAWPGATTRSTDAIGAPEVIAARLSADGKQVTLVNENGDIQIRQTGDGAIVRTISGISQDLVP
jgi:hypothetical protein